MDYGVPRKVSYKEARICFIPDPHNKAAMEWTTQMEKIDEDNDVDLFVPVGGDGHMLRTIRRLYQRNIPFAGVNCGHRGFLLSRKIPVEKFLLSQFILHNLPMLDVRVTLSDGTTKRELAFNDAWIQAQPGQAATTRIKVDGHVFSKRLASDGVLISTPAGSTAYAHAMGATPLPLDSRSLILVGSNVARPSYMEPGVLSLSSEVIFTSTELEKRPVLAFVDGIELGLAIEMRIRVCATQGVELALTQASDIKRKLRILQFGH